MDETEALVCPHCGNPECTEDDQYCFNCGKPLRNYCTNQGCEICIGNIELSPNMCYCPECGEETFFMKLEYISPQTF